MFLIIFLDRAKSRRKEKDVNSRSSIFNPKITNLELLNLLSHKVLPSSESQLFIAYKSQTQLFG